MPTFADPFQQHQAEQLLQPVLIRVVDNLRKAMEASNWIGTYEEHLLWPEGTTTAEQEQVRQIAAQLEDADPETAQHLQEQLSHLPMPFPGYELRLSQGEHTQRIDVWNLCYQVCFTHYDPDTPAEVDPHLLDEVGDVDWLALDEKAQQLVQAAFEQLGEGRKD
ncbi:MAG: hypothetical protein ICV77_03855 [Cyanobacteria bacterium Co-bin8]|nr:hypothetical protein [Cyanobacteria bacterium Co-bin8]